MNCVHHSSRPAESRLGISTPLLGRAACARGDWKIYATRDNVKLFLLSSHVKFAFNFLGFNSAQHSVGFSLFLLWIRGDRIAETEVIYPKLHERVCMYIATIRTWENFSIRLLKFLKNFRIWLLDLRQLCGSISQAEVWSSESLFLEFRLIFCSGQR